MELDTSVKQKVVVFSVLYIILNAILTFNEFFWLNLLPLVLLLVYLLLFHFEVYLFILIALLPISLPLNSLIKDSSFYLTIPSGLLIIIATIFFVLKIIFENSINKKILGHPVSVAIFINLIWVFITSLTSSLPLVSFRFLAYRIEFVLIFYFLFLLIFISYKKFYTFLWCFSLSFIFVIFYFINRLFTYGISNIMRTANWVSKPFFPDHTSYATAMAMLLTVLGFSIFIYKRSKISYKLFNLLIFVILLFGLIISYTRAAWFSLFVACCFIIPHLLKIKLKYSLTIVFVLIIGLWISWTQIQLSLINNHQQSSSNILKHLQSTTNVSSDASNLERINRWNSAFKMFKERPIFGFGPGTYSFMYAPYQATSDKTFISTNYGNLGNAHSEYLGPLSESGILGFLSILGIMLTSLFTASRVYFTSDKRKIKYLALALMIGLLSYDIHGIMNNFLDLDKLNCLFWGFTAMIVALDLYHNKNKEKKRSIFYY